LEKKKKKKKIRREENKHRRRIQTSMDSQSIRTYDYGV